METQYYYKYMSLKKWEYFLDILLNNRLHASVYTELNDYMEGHFRAERFTRQDWERINKAKKDILICSTSTSANNALMWSHYADGHKGCCIVFEVPKQTQWTRLPIKYQLLPATLDPTQSTDESLRLIYSIKSEFWMYEDEVRFIRKKVSNRIIPYLPIRVVGIELGIRVPDNQVRLINSMVKLVNDARKTQIEVRKTTIQDIRFFKNW